jgi:hypothetical protein
MENGKIPSSWNGSELSKMGASRGVGLAGGGGASEVDGVESPDTDGRGVSGAGGAGSSDAGGGGSSGGEGGDTSGTGGFGTGGAVGAAFSSVWEVETSVDELEMDSDELSGKSTTLAWVLKGMMAVATVSLGSGSVLDATTEILDVLAPASSLDGWSVSARADPASRSPVPVVSAIDAVSIECGVVLVAQGTQVSVDDPFTVILLPSLLAEVFGQHMAMVVGLIWLT